MASLGGSFSGNLAYFARDASFLLKPAKAS